MRGATLWLAMAATAALAVGGTPAERCFAWTRAATGAEPGDRAGRFVRGYDACLASEGYVPVQPDELPSQPPSVLVVGQPVAFKPVALPVSVICDDLDVVRVDDGGTFLWLTGLKPGETTCSFGGAVHAGRRFVYHFVVRAGSTK